MKFIDFFINFIILNRLVNLGAKYDSYGFFTNKSMENNGISNIFILGQLSRNFNPTRKTIISAVENNSKLASKKIYKNIFIKN